MPRECQVGLKELHFLVEISMHEMGVEPLRRGANFCILEEGVVTDYSGCRVLDRVGRGICPCPPPISLYLSMDGAEGIGVWVLQSVITRTRLGL